MTKTSAVKSVGCAKARSVRSESSPTASQLVIHNNTSGKVFVYWIDYAGKRKKWDVSAWYDRKFYTYLRQPWLITSGWTPFHLIVCANAITVSTLSSSAPFQCISKIPQQRSMGLYLLWYGG